MRDRRHSIAAIKWLKWVSHSEEVDIQHAHNGGEVRIGTFYVDGQDRNNKKQLFEFNGCAFHGCPRCFPKREQLLPRSYMTAHEACELTAERQAHLEGDGYRLRSVWECEVNLQLRRDTAMKAYYASIVINGEGPYSLYRITGQTLT